VTRESPRKAILVVLLTAMICSTLVSAAVVVLRPIQLNNQLLERGRHVVLLSGLQAGDALPDDEQTLALLKRLDARLVDLDDGRFSDELDPTGFDERRAAGNRELGEPIPPEQDLAGLGRRSRLMPVYLVWDGNELERVVLPVQGKGMWSDLFGYIALESDLETIAGMTFYDQNETPGLGDQILHERWLQQWRGRRIFDDRGVPVFQVSQGEVGEYSDAAQYQVDALTGATVTGDAVTAMIRYWFGPHGYGAFLARLKADPPERRENGS
jgi:Na+-transporting NADH:ubiquinone oxidoreductase subunit C